MSWIRKTFILFCLALSVALAADNLSFGFSSPKSSEISNELVSVSSRGTAEGAISEKQQRQEGEKIADSERIESKTQIDNVDQQNYQFRGVHFLASYCDCDLQALTELNNLAAAMTNVVEKSGATVLEVSSWEFPPDGLTMLFLLSESHASIHTYPEHRACFVDLFTRGDNCSAEKFDEALREYLKPKTVNLRTFIRNEGIQEKCTDKYLSELTYYAF